MAVTRKVGVIKMTAGSDSVSGNVYVRRVLADPSDETATAQAILQDSDGNEIFAITLAPNEGGVLFEICLPSDGVTLSTATNIGRVLIYE